MTIPRRFSRYSKMTPELEAELVRQIQLRRQIRSWEQIAESAGISRRNMYYHVRRLSHDPNTQLRHKQDGNSNGIGTS